MSSEENQEVICASCGGTIELRNEHWEAVESDYPNPRHCYYSARNGHSMEHTPDDDQGM